MKEEMKPPVMGICKTMCPQSEIEWRTEAGLLHKFEMLSGTENDTRPKADIKKVIKQFVRSVAWNEEDRNASEILRPGSVLMDTTHYLIDELIPETNAPWNIIYNYVFDRLRAVRQDMVMQNINGPVKIYVLERSVIFHLYFSYRLCEEPMRLFDPVINENHLRECLDSLLIEYEECLDDLSVQENRYLFESLYIIHNLGMPKALLRYGNLGKKYQKNLLVSNCFILSKLFMNKNYYRVLKLANRLPTILLLSFNYHMETIQEEYLRRICVAFHCKNAKIPLKALTEWMSPFEYNLKAITSLCKNFGQKISDDKLSVLIDKKNLPQSEHIKSKTRMFQRSLLNSRLEDYTFESLLVH